MSFLNSQIHVSLRDLPLVFNHFIGIIRRIQSWLHICIIGYIILAGKPTDKVLRDRVIEGKCPFGRRSNDKMIKNTSWNRRVNNIGCNCL